MNSSVSTKRVNHLPALPLRPIDAHKGTFGRAAIIAGSRGMSGAAALAGLGALRGGAGLVHVLVPRGIAAIVAAVEPSYLTVGLPEDDAGRLSLRSRAKLSEVISNSSAVAVGPGWGVSDDLVELARWLFTTAAVPMVVDADGLNALAKLPEMSQPEPRLPEGSAVRILSPHPGEFARLSGLDAAEFEQNREQAAVRFAEDNRVVLVLKGHQSVVTDGQKLAVNTTGNSGMATGGTGDVLTGLMTALLCAGMSAFEAAQLSVHLHGLAGDLAAEKLTGRAMIASDLPRVLPKAWARLEAR